jgi:hypothetical protein
MGDRGECLSPSEHVQNEVTGEANVVERTSGRRRKFPWVAVSTVAGVVGALATVAVFFIPSADSRSPSNGDAPGRSISVTGSPGMSTSGSSTSSTTEAGETRFVAELALRAGVGLVKPVGRDIMIPCPNNQSDDSERQFSYDLPARYASLVAGVSVSGDADPDATAAVQVYIQHRQERSDRVPEAGRAVVAVGRPGNLNVTLGDAVIVSFRVTCSASSQTVRLVSPRIAR